MTPIPGNGHLPSEPASPLREPTYYILLSVARGQKHGYAILKDVSELSGGKLRLSTGTLYEALARLAEQGLIERVDDGEEPDPTPGKPRKAYRITSAGRSVLDGEVARLRSLLTAAQRRLESEGE